MADGVNLFPNLSVFAIAKDDFLSILTLDHNAS